MDLTKHSRITLNDGQKIPVVGLGTYAPEEPFSQSRLSVILQFPKSMVEEAVKVALQDGYRHIDSALIYGNEVEVGRAINAKIADGTVKREDVFYTSKLWSTYQSPEWVRRGLEKTLKDVQLEYIDLFLIHNPVEFKPGHELMPTDASGKLIYHNTDIRETWKTKWVLREYVSTLHGDTVYLQDLRSARPATPPISAPLSQKTLIDWPSALKAVLDVRPVPARGDAAVFIAMEDLKESGLVKSIGVSSFNHKQLEYILTMPGLRYKPVCNQVECHLFLSQSKLLEFCKSHDIILVAFGVLGSTRDPNWVDQTAPVLLEDLVLNRIAKKYGRPPAQVAMRHMLQRGIVVLAKSFKPERIKQNLEVFNFKLSEEDMKCLNALNQNRRYQDLKWEEHPKYPFHEEY